VVGRRIRAELAEEKRELPVRSLHDFLSEISREWDSFRMGSLISMITTVILFGLVIALGYNMYLAYRQHAFYQRWEKRIALLLHMEDELLGK
jgi:RsiW-degrading membrane proteinase PrsW (M82 family)